MDLIDSPRTGRRIAIIDGRLPSSAEWLRIRINGWGVNILSLPGGSETLEPIRSQLEWLPEIWVNSASCDLLGEISNARQLNCLMVGGVVRDVVDVSSLGLLEVFAGPASRFSGLLELPLLRDLTILADEVEGQLIASPVTRLRLDLRGSSQIPRFASAELRELELFSSNGFDLGQLESFDRLEVVRLQAIARLENPEILGRLPRLRQLVFEDCPHIDRQQMLLELQPMAQVRVVGKNPFGPAFRSSAARASATWIFPPGKRFLPADAPAPSEFLLHPGLDHPLPVPHEAGDGVPWRDLLDPQWDAAPASQRLLELRALALKVRESALALGDVVASDSEGRRQSLISTDGEYSLSLDGVTIACFPEDLEDGIIIDERVARRLESEPGP